ncbi:MAG TPA: hypothetical protein VI111_11040 [Thermoleophilaceae bacterium]
MVLAVALGAPASATAAASPRFFGVSYDRAAANASAPLQTEQFRTMHEAGVGAVRTVFSWAHAQPERGGPVDFERTDALVADATAADVELLPIVMYAPPWARARPSRFASPPRDAGAYAHYLSQLMGRYGSGGSFWAEHPELPARPVRAWQIWNEPHLPWQWDLAGRGRWQRGYTALLKRAHRTIKRRDRGARVVLAGLTNVSWRELARLYKAGARGSFDVAAVHVYTASVDNVFRVVKLFRTVMRRHHDARTPLWMTEVSWPAARGKVDPGPGFRSVVTTDEGMASRLAGLYRRALRAQRSQHLQRVYWYSWGTSYVGSEDSFDYAGLGSYRDDIFIAKPALQAFSRLARGGTASAAALH